jgi:putative methylase
MGQHAQKRLIRKLDLEMFLSKIAINPSPKANLEQYTTPPSIAATMLYLAAYTNNDIIGKKILDLGCGTGRLGLGAAFLGAEQVIGVDIDKSALQIAVENSRLAGLTENAEWLVGGIDAIEGCFDTVLQNPPFGVQTRNADRAFLVKALKVGKMVYSLHNHPEVDKRLLGMLKSGKGLVEIAPSPFLKRFIEEHGGTIRVVYALLMTIPKMFDFHTKKRHDFVIDLYIIEESKTKQT